MRIDEENKRIYVRQSWLGDMTICAERARLGITRPEFRSGSDATIIGTAMHTGIEAVLNSNGEMSYEDMMTVAKDDYAHLASLPHKVTNIDPNSIMDSMAGMGEAFYSGILPQVTLGGKTEFKFSVPLLVTYEDYSIYLEGTMDYIDPNGTIWDWKTASRVYYGKDKQKSAIQPTAYAYAAQYLALAGDDVEFNYGVMVRQATPKHQVVPIYRNLSHADWLQYYVQATVSSTMSMGISKPWLLNDSSALCSENWCSFWSICKGAFGCR